MTSVSIAHLTCIGAPLARMEIGAVVERWCARIGVSASVVHPTEWVRPRVAAATTRAGAPLGLTIAIEP